MPSVSSSRIIDFELLQSAADAVGISLVGGLTDAAIDTCFEQDRLALERWQLAGNAGEMRYMERSADLLTRPKALEPQLRSILSFAIPYLQSSPRSSESSVAGYGRVARYAWGRDYHRALKHRLKRFVSEVAARRPDLNPITYRLFSDAVPMLERAIAKHAGLGFIGKNTMLIRPGHGSYYFLAEVLWDIEVRDPSITSSAESAESQQKKEPCGSCRRCLNSCPTEAFDEARVLDARRCISYLTIEKRGEFNDWESAAVGGWVFGCDVCQEVCPFNHEGIPRSALKEFSPESGAGEALSIVDLLTIPSPEAFLSRFAGTAIMRAGWLKMMRNAAAVAANSAYLPAIQSLIPMIAADDRGVSREARRSLRKLATLADGLDRRRIITALNSGPSD